MLWSLYTIVEYGSIDAVGRQILPLMSIHTPSTQAFERRRQVWVRGGRHQQIIYDPMNKTDAFVLSLTTLELDHLLCLANSDCTNTTYTQ